MIARTEISPFKREITNTTLLKDTCRILKCGEAQTDYKCVFPYRMYVFLQGALVTSTLSAAVCAPVLHTTRAAVSSVVFSCTEPGLAANIQGKTRADWGEQFTVMTDLTNSTLNWQICSSSVKCGLVCGAESVVQFFLKYWRYLLSKWGYESRSTALNLHGSCSRFLAELLAEM